MNTQWNLSKSGIEYLPPCGICQFAIKSIIIDSEIAWFNTDMYLHVFGVVNIFWNAAHNLNGI